MLVTLYIFLFLLSIVTMWQKKYIISIFLATLFTAKGLYILPLSAGPIKLSYLSFLYIILFCWMHSQNILKIATKSPVGKALITLSIFFVFSIAFSIFYYQFPALDTIITGSRYFAFLILYVYYSLSPKDFTKLIQLLFYITLTTSVLYILQCLTGRILLAYEAEKVGALSNGLFRFYNVPPFATVFLIITLFTTNFLPKKYRILAVIVFLLQIFLSNGRAAILQVFLMVTVGMLLNGFKARNFVIAVLVAIPFFLTQAYIEERMENDGKTSTDIELILKGDFIHADYQSRNGYTMLYRIAWIKERWEYMKTRPFPETLFGLGLLPDEHKAIQNKYHFRYGLPLPDGSTAQLRTPDIAFGMFLTGYGLLGSFLFFLFFFRMLISLWRSNTKYAKALFSYMVVIPIGGFTGSALAEPTFFVTTLLCFAFWDVMNRKQNVAITYKGAYDSHFRNRSYL